MDISKGNTSCTCGVFIVCYVFTLFIDNDTRKGNTSYTYGVLIVCYLLTES